MGKFQSERCLNPFHRPVEVREKQNAMVLTQIRRQQLINVHSLNLTEVCKDMLPLASCHVLRPLPTHRADFKHCAGAAGHPLELLVRVAFQGFRMDML